MFQILGKNPRKGKSCLSRLHRSDSLDELLSGDVECPDWRKTLPPERLTGIPKREQKRQDVINELFHTERNHVRNLRILDNVFRKPLQESGPELPANTDKKKTSKKPALKQFDRH